MPSAATPVVIDLDVWGPGPPVAGPTRLLWSAWLSRRVVPVLMAVACLAGLAGSTPSRPGFLVARWSASISLVGFSLGADALYLSEPGAGSMAAVRPDTGDVLWRLPITDLVQTVELGGGEAAVVTHSPAGDQNLVTLVDIRTGATLGRRQGDVLGRYGPVVLMAAATSAPTDECASTFGCVDVLGVDPLTAQTRWLIPSVAPQDWFIDATDGRVASLVTVGGNGALNLRDRATGTVSATLTLPERATEELRVWVANTFVLARYRAGLIEMEGNRLEPFGQAWARQLPVGGLDTYVDPASFASDCGRLLCVHVGDATTVIDPVSGRIILHNGYNLGVRHGGGVLVWQLGNPQDSHTVMRLDPRDTAVARSYPNAEVLDWPDGDGRALVRQEAKGRSEFIMIDPGGHEWNLGRVDGVHLRCQVRARTLACAGPDSTLRVWRILA